MIQHAPPPKSPMTQHLYTDGSTAGPNPSPLGGAWAYRVVDERPWGPAVIEERSGWIEPARMPDGRVTSNQAELLAALAALASRPPWWEGVLWTDSSVTMSRLLGGGTKKGMPDWLVQMLAGARDARALRLRQGLPSWSVSLVGAHPTRKELACGFKARKKTPVSAHNVACDRLCREVCQEFTVSSAGA
jgi:ribonuclease HI